MLRVKNTKREKPSTLACSFMHRVAAVDDSPSKEPFNTTGMICIRSRVSSTKMVAQEQAAQRPTLHCAVPDMSPSTGSGKPACPREWTLAQAPQLHRPNPSPMPPPDPQHPPVATSISTSSPRQSPCLGCTCISSRLPPPRKLTSHAAEWLRHSDG